MIKRVRIIGITLVIMLSCTAMVMALQPGEQNITNTSQPDRLDDILSRGTLIVAINQDSAPYSEIIKGSKRNTDSKCDDIQYTENQVAGFDVDVTNGIARELGVDSCYVTPDFDEVDRGNWINKWDIYPGYYITYEHLNQLYFTQPITSDPSVFYIRKDDANITSPADLSGKIIGTYPNSAQSRYLNNTLELPGIVNENPVKNATVVGYNVDSSAFSDLVSGKLNAVLLPENSGDVAIENGSPITALEPYAFSGYSGLAVENGIGSDPRSFIRKLTDIINKMHEGGELSRLSTKYFKKDLTKEAKIFNITSLNQFKDYKCAG